MTRILNAFQALAWIFLLCLVATVARAQVTSTRIESASWTCRDASGAILTSHERQDKAQEECTNRALKSPGTAFEIRPSGFRIVAVAVTPPQTTGSATIRWIPPTQNTDGSALTNLAGFRVVHGTSTSALDRTVEVANASVSSYVVTGLTAGAWYFAVRAYSSAGAESANSNVASKTI